MITFHKYVIQFVIKSAKKCKQTHAVLSKHSITSELFKVFSNNDTDTKGMQYHHHQPY